MLSYFYVKDCYEKSPASVKSGFDFNNVTYIAVCYIGNEL